MKMWSIQRMEDYLELKRNELSSHEKPGRNLRCILPSKETRLEMLIAAICCSVLEKERQG